ncbi:class I SAM-dependent DNA methyltransferase [Ligilactobacillus salivarius]|uniref:class I SAM-dependent DNA methyltransferase n=1 Tax=Ligilactobacillus salivarius TaxID=1624 RepID=UPI001371ABF2|nr:DNA methyltransferase [Ligilactobacillus salivarius]MYU60157.1 class I SAM-dependent DNA methyltransferase [Ligilactobacillus salivarius]MYU85515.1 class I SAM-dependent DNA methyltransferase [Ligilactobacillus salivarius]MYZ81184.1 class I SAM-dependent DNA methyltransferase [Ligilactobacillus salivarius]
MSGYAFVVFSKKSRNLIIEAGELIGWDKVNPDILGSMLQAVASEDKRSHLGMHYTSVPNIMKVINPLFLDDLHEEFEKAKGNETKLNNLLERMRKMKFMDPACGSGNFLIITYKELRRLEMDIFEELGKINNSTMYVPTIDLGQFYGIELEDFAVDVTRLSLYIADHQMNLELKRRYGDYLRETLPLHKVGDIRCGNALRLDWNEILPHEKDDEVYLFGNPPYLGSREQNKDQKMDMEHVLGSIKGFKNLDYISNWFYLATKYIYRSNAEFAFVTTNSICQGVQVGILWPKLLDKIEIFFAHTSFKWENNAKNNAGVTVVIIGCRNFNTNEKHLFMGNIVQKVQNISPYLAEGDNRVIFSTNSPLNRLPKMVFGSMPRDGGNLILSEKEYLLLQKELPDNIRNKVLRKYIGSTEFINGTIRYCIWMNERDYMKLIDNQEIKKHIQDVKNFRMSSSAKSTVQAAKTPWAFVQKGEYVKSFGDKLPSNRLSIIVPRVSSENRMYVPMGVVDASTIISDSAMAIYDAPLWLLGLLESRMHMVWLRNVGGKLKTDYRYSAGLVYNTFPVPELSTRRKNEIEELIGNILDIREEEGGTLAELYGSPLAAKNPKPMNPRLLEAHKELDKVVDRAYKSTDFKDDNERLALLLNMYSEMVNKKG